MQDLVTRVAARLNQIDPSIKARVYEVAPFLLIKTTRAEHAGYATFAPMGDYWLWTAYDGDGEHEWLVESWVPADCTDVAEIVECYQQMRVRTEYVPAPGDRDFWNV